MGGLVIDNKIAERVVAAKNGDKKAFALLYRETLTAVYFIAFKMVKDENTAWKIVKLTYVKAMTAIEMLKNPNAFEQWVKHIAAKKCRDFLKNEGVDFGETEERFFISESDEDDEGEFLPESLIEKEGSEKMISDIVGSLPEVLRLTVLMYYYNGVSVTSIAKCFGCDEAVVKSHLKAAKGTIKDEVEKVTGEKIESVNDNKTPVLTTLLYKASDDQAIDPDIAAEVFRKAAGKANLLSGSDSGSGDQNRPAKEPVYEKEPRQEAVSKPGHKKKKSLTPGKQVFIALLVLAFFVGVVWGVAMKKNGIESFDDFKEYVSYAKESVISLFIKDDVKQKESTTVPEISEAELTEFSIPESVTESTEATTT
ncbi:MAG: sigma-70 family RNA polymerase sigma factor [Clostridiales bacterium]|nr:sigma-70 family RNA polymerase sigma factor [Clostridiales bacterium]